MFGGNRLRQLERQKTDANFRAAVNAERADRHRDERRRAVERAQAAEAEADAERKRAEKAESRADVCQRDAEDMVQKLDRAEGERTRMAESLRAANDNAEYWRDLYYSAAERADDAEQFAYEDRQALVGARQRAEKAEGHRDHVSALLDNERQRADSAEDRANTNAKRAERFRVAADYWRNAYGKLSASVVTGKAETDPKADDPGTQFRVEYRQMRGFTEHRRRVVIGPFRCADARDMEAERLRRPHERVHIMEPMT